MPHHEEVTVLQQVAIIVWTIAAISTTMCVLSRRCKGVLRCTAIAFVSMCAFGRAWTLVRGDIQMDVVGVSIGLGLAVYFGARADALWRHPETEEPL